MVFPLAVSILHTRYLESLRFSVNELIEMLPVIRNQSFNRPTHLDAI